MRTDKRADLEKLAKWYSENGLEVNLEKSKFVVYGHRKDNEEFDGAIKIPDQNRCLTALEGVSEMKYLY